MTHLLSTELRHIEVSHLRNLSAIIDQAQDWRKLMEELTKPVVPTFDDSHIKGLKLTPGAVSLIEQQFRCGESPTLALLNHWAITGRRRPTVGNLLGLLNMCGLKWAEDYLCKSVLRIESIQIIPKDLKRTPTKPLLRPIDDQFKFENLNDLVNIFGTNCPRYSFQSIYETTNGFCHQPYDPVNQTGVKIGEGRFSSVYRAKTRIVTKSECQSEQVVAAKLLKSECNEKFLVNEINLMRKVQHNNILKLLGISLGEVESDSYAYICLIYPYMQNGSLFNCLQEGLPTRRETVHLTWKRRYFIASKVAEAIVYLHSFPEGAIIHRDIKTANIFIDINLDPKVGDFTLVRQLDLFGETQHSQNVIGTSVYMPPEAFRGDISTKFDTFSFGIVLLELLTGMKPFKEDADLFTYINEQLSDIDDHLASGSGNQQNLVEERDKFLKSILDRHADWNFQCAKTMFELALKATESRKRNRPEMSYILEELESCRPSMVDDGT